MWHVCVCGCVHVSRYAWRVCLKGWALEEPLRSELRHIACKRPSLPPAPAMSEMSKKRWSNFKIEIGRWGAPPIAQGIARSPLTRRAPGQKKRMKFKTRRRG